MEYLGPCRNSNVDRKTTSTHIKALLLAASPGERKALRTTMGLGFKEQTKRKTKWTYVGSLLQGLGCSDLDNENIVLEVCTYMYTYIPFPRTKKNKHKLPQT